MWVYILYIHVYILAEGSLHHYMASRLDYQIWNDDGIVPRCNAIAASCLDRHLYAVEMGGG